MAHSLDEKKGNCFIISRWVTFCIKKEYIVELLVSTSPSMAVYQPPKLALNLICLVHTHGPSTGGGSPLQTPPLEFRLMLSSVQRCHISEISGILKIQKRWKFLFRKKQLLAFEQENPMSLKLFDSMADVFKSFLSKFEKMKLI
ncbi:hypothetical protein PoB_003172800 [Plakobranchus ocellatus]|uniref:Uncharacterized protein n=1 Tax=Plakobranchus ocellatus TaxID=259542 RepID=A0AAV4AEJ2_9GAST|nr:hypothetical protein PoB_003172800 [Plakobranchus ocellatus]